MGIYLFITGIMCFDKVFVWENEENFSTAILSVPKPNYREIVTQTITRFNAGDYQAAQQYLARLRRDYAQAPASRSLSIRLFADSMEGAILVRTGKPAAGMKKLIKVLSHPNWSLLANSSYGYPRFILLMTAQLCQKAGQKKNAAEIYRRLAEFYGAFEPLEREFYLALTALCLDDKITALRH